jgi:hypothetical protein
MQKATPVFAILSGFSVFFMVLVIHPPFFDGNPFPQILIPLIFATFASAGLTWIDPQRHITTIFAICLPMIFIACWALIANAMQGDSMFLWSVNPSVFTLAASCAGGNAALWLKQNPQALQKNQATALSA